MNAKESPKYTVVKLHELSLANRKRDDEAKQRITESGKCKNQIYNGDSYKEQVPLRYPYNTKENKDSLPIKAHSKKEVREILHLRVS